MPKVHLTTSFVRKAACPLDAQKIDFFDTHLPGFLLEVRKSGGKTYYQRCNIQGAKRCQLRIGPAYILSLAQAKRRAKTIAARSLIGAGSSPPKQWLVQPTYGTFIQGLYLPFARVAKRSWRTDETILRLHILPFLARLPLNEVSHVEVAELLKQKRTEGYSTGTTNRILILIRHTFNLAVKWRVHGCAQDPTSGLSRYPEAYKQRFLSVQDARKLMKALANDPNQLAATAIKLLLLTGARRNEITHARWIDIDWRTRTLLVPISKSGKPRHIALNAHAIDVLRSVKPLEGNPYIFPCPTTAKPPASLHFPWRRIKRSVGLDGLRLHDLRHSFASFLVSHGISLYTVQQLLGHSQPRMTQRYAHLTSDTLVQAADVMTTVLASDAIA